MARSGPALSVVAALGLCLTPARLAAHTARVSGPRVHLGELLAGLPEPLRSLDMGSAPEPQAQARYTRADLLARIHAARLTMPRGRIVPRVVQVVRCGQSLDALQLTRLVRQSLITHLPVGSRIASLRLHGGLSLPEGAIDIAPELPATLGSGEQVLRLRISTQAPGAQASAPIYVQAVVDIDVPRAPKGVPVLGRGSEVIVQVRTPGVLVQAAGLAQEAGSVGDLIRVLPHLSSRMVQARIVDARTVEVRL